MKLFSGVLLAPEGLGNGLGAAPGQALEQAVIPGAVETPQPAAAEPAAVVPAAAEPVAAAPVVPEATPAAEPKAKPWYEKRIDQLTREKYETRGQMDTMQQQLIELQTRMRVNGVMQTPPALPVAGQPAPGAAAPQQTMTLTPAQLEAMVDKRALELSSGVAAETSFTNKCNAVYEKGLTDYPDFKDSLGSLQTVGVDKNFLENLVELENPSKIAYELGKDPERAQKIMALGPKAQLKELLKLDTAKAATSAAPAPITPKVAGGLTGVVQTTDSNVPIDKWMEMRNKEAAAARPH